MSFIKYLYTLAVSLFFTTCVIAQSDTLKYIKIEAPTEVEDESSNLKQMPEFIGDYKTFLAGCKLYPEDANKEEIEGKVYVRFIIEINGSISDVKIIKGVHPLLNEEAIRVVKLTNGKWKSGYNNNGKPVRVYKNMVIEFNRSEN